MQTVVSFVVGDKGKYKNKLYSRSMGKFTFVDNQYPREGAYPRREEHWLVEIVRENLSKAGPGCFIIQPIRLIPESERVPLIHGMYDLKIDEDAVLVIPKNMTKLYVMSRATKEALVNGTPGARALVIAQGGEMWPRRRPAESVFEDEVKKLVIEDDAV